MSAFEILNNKNMAGFLEIGQNVKYISANDVGKSL